MPHRMIFVHEIHEVMAGKMEAFGEAVRTVWRPLLEERGEARLCWFWELTHGTGPSYQVVSITAVRDLATWGAIVERGRTDPRVREWQKLSWTLRRDSVSKVLVPTAWSALQEVDLAAPPVNATVAEPTLYLHDTGWPFPGKLEEYTEALGSIFYPQAKQSRMIEIAACWTVLPGTGRHHEVVLLQKILDWERFAQLLTRGEQGAQKGGWMEAGLRYRDRWESKLLRCARWSPRQ